MEPKWSQNGVSGSQNGASWGYLLDKLFLCAFFAPFLSHLGAILAPSWGILGASWVILGASWSQVGASWSQPGAYWSQTGAFWTKLRHFRGMLGLRWSSWKHSGAKLGPSCSWKWFLEPFGTHFLLIFHDSSCPEPSIFDERLERNAYF